MIASVLGVEIEYETYGTGSTPVLLLHGWGGNLKSLSSFGNMLKNNFCVHALTFPTQAHNQPLDMPFYVMLIKKFIEENNLLNCIVICHSFGARVALMLAAQTNYISKLVVIAGAGIKPKFNLITWLKIKIYKLKKKLNLLSKNKVYGSADYKQLNNVQKQTFNNVISFDITKYCYYISCPTLLIWGNKDAQTPIYMAKKLQRIIKNSKLVIMKNCGHFVFEENFTQCFDEIERFLC